MAVSWTRNRKRQVQRPDHYTSEAPTTNIVCYISDVQFIHISLGLRPKFDDRLE